MWPSSPYSASVAVSHIRGYSNLQIVVVSAGSLELTLSGQAHAFADQLAKLLELAGVGIIISSVLIATALFVMSGLRDRRWRGAYEGYRSNLGRGILLGLELLVGADIIFTITAPLTWQSVGLLAGIVVIRTFLSFSLETEIEGCWPWQRAQRGSPGRTVTKNT